jgi:hypothetical protein
VLIDTLLIYEVRYNERVYSLEKLECKRGNWTVSWGIEYLGTRPARILMLNAKDVFLVN